MCTARASQTVTPNNTPQDSRGEKKNTFKLPKKKKKKYFSGTLRFQFSLFNETYFQVKDKLLLVNLTFCLVSRFLKLEIVPDNKN